MHRTLLTISVGRVLRGPGGRSPPGIGGWGSGLLRAGDDGQSARLGLNHLGDGAGVDIVAAGQLHQVLQVVDEILNQEVITGGPGLVKAMTDIIDSGDDFLVENLIDDLQNLMELAGRNDVDTGLIAEVIQAETGALPVIPSPEEL